MNSGTDYGIQTLWATSQQYASVAQHSKKRNMLYDNYLQIFQKVFTAYRQFYEQTQQLFKAKQHTKIIYVEQFKSFLRKFAQIVKDTSSYQIQCISNTRTYFDDTIARTTAQMIYKVDGYAKCQKVFKEKLDILMEKRQEVIKQFFNLRSQSADASVYYNSKQMKNKAKSILQKLDDIKQLEKQLNTGKLQINNNAEQFQSYLLSFRKKLLQNKYNTFNRMIEESKHFRNCLTQILLLLIQCVNKNTQIFMSLVKNHKQDSINQSRGKKKFQDLDSIVSNLVNSIQQYNQLIDEIIFILKGLDNAFKKLNAKILQIMENHKKYLMDNLNQMYTFQETPSKQVDETLDIYEFYSSKIIGISDRLYQCCNNLMTLKQNVKKHADVTLSLLRSNQAVKGKEEGRFPQLQQVYNQISDDFVTQVLCDVYKSFKQVLVGLKTHFNQRYYKKKKNRVQDSMQISHIDQTTIAQNQKKKPCKRQLWLWRDWRDKVTFAVPPPDATIKQVDSFASAIKFQEQSKQFGKFECTFRGKKDVKGIMKVCQKAIEFITIIGSTNIQLCISYNDIDTVQLKVRAAQKDIAIDTQKGLLQFTKFMDPQTVENLIKQCMQKANKQGGKVVKKQAVQLTPQQIDFLQKNRNKLNDQRPSIEGMNKIKSIFVDNITVDQVCQFIYSDKPFTLRGKPEQSFFAYFAKKYKNFNYKPGSYDKPGPQFYTHNPEVKFTNSPLFSYRMNQYDHPIPAIPFMPKFCHCKQHGKLYWLSNQNFDYYIQSESSGAPYADTMVVKIVHRIYKEGTGVRGEFMGGAFIVKDSAMQGILKSKGEKEIQEIGTLVMNQIERTLNIVSGNTAQNEKQNIQDKIQQTKLQKKVSLNSEVSKLQTQKKLLIIALVVVFVFNIIARVFM